ncbi:MAG: hypothetical protein AAF998_06920 [Bacteroidota bacterium]
MTTVQINWNNIRAIEGQREGFEELVCQLAAKEKYPIGSNFVRIGKPDAGKECFWEFPDGSMHLWQAKFFTKSPDSDQWKQLDKSVKKALGKHPKMVRYIVAIPVDRPDAKVGRGKSMLTRWNESVKEWTELAKGLGHSVEFEYWGAFELRQRLIRPENQGLRHYWFNIEEFTDDWFDKVNQQSFDALGARYSPELNFDLPISLNFDGLSREDQIRKKLKKHLATIWEKRSRISLSKDHQEEYAQISNTLRILCEKYASVDLSGNHIVNFTALDSGLQEVNNLCWENIKRVDSDRSNYERNASLRRQLYEFSQSMEELQEFVRSGACYLVNKPFMILIGEAGIGKSHLIADVVNRRASIGQISLLLLGESFSSVEMPWTQILKNQLHKPHLDDATFLGALNAKAESKQERIIVFIDALNEGEGRRVWKNQLKSFIRSFKVFPWIGLVVSIRDSYEELIAPADIDESFAKRVFHEGFSESTFEASEHFFEHFKIAPPQVPLLHPEFQNPLFLKLLCEGLVKKGMRAVPEGFGGITEIIRFFLEGVNKKLADPHELDYDENLSPVEKTVEGILDWMISNDSKIVPYQDANLIALESFRSCGVNTSRPLKILISEGVLNVNLFWDESHGAIEGVHFAYERFEDHLYVQKLLEKYLDIDDPMGSFEKDELIELFTVEDAQYFNRQYFEALSVQIPEITGKELFECVPQWEKTYVVADAFINSLKWRKSNNFGKKAEEYAEKLSQAKDRNIYYRFLDAILSKAMQRDFVFNADHLHEVLLPQKMAERDAWWTTSFLHPRFGELGQFSNVSRLINWAWRANSTKHLSPDAVVLGATVLAWFFTSSNRSLRDSATKALISLLENRIEELIVLLRKFEDVNDPYVMDRLYAVAYGCAVRTNQRVELKELAEYVYHVVFEVEEVYPHILMRDYAKGVIEYATHLDLEPHADRDRFAPPYHSTLPSKFPTNDEIDEKYSPKGEDGHYGHKHWSAGAILRSMTTEYGRGTSQYGDFGRYTFQSAFWNFKVDYDGLSNYAVQRIFEMGYDPELFDHFDSQQGGGRGRHSGERIGKKYQWIAFYELLARVADNIPMIDLSDSGRRVEKGEMPYLGSHLPYVRDIDPTMLIKRTPQWSNYNDEYSLPWWVPDINPTWNRSLKEWQLDITDIPPLEQFLCIHDQRGNEWIQLDLFISRHRPEEITKDSHGNKQVRLEMNIKTFLIANADLGLLDHPDVKKVAFNDIRMSDSTCYRLFSREFFWAPQWTSIANSSYYGGELVGSEHFVGGKSLVLYRTTTNFLWEEEFDYSKEEVISYYKPHAHLAEGLEFAAEEGKLKLPLGEIVCMDPSVMEAGPSCMLVRKGFLEKRLSELDMSLIWVVEAEKMVFGYDLPKGRDIRNTGFGIFKFPESGMKLKWDRAKKNGKERL